MDLSSYEVYATREEGVRLEHNSCGERFIYEWDIANLEDPSSISSILTAATQHDVVCRVSKKRPSDPGRKVTRAG